MFFWHPTSNDPEFTRSYGQFFTIDIIKAGEKCNETCIYLDLLKIITLAVRVENIMLTTIFNTKWAFFAHFNPKMSHILTSWV